MELPYVHCVSNAFELQLQTESESKSKSVSIESIKSIDTAVTVTNDKQELENTTTNNIPSNNEINNNDFQSNLFIKDCSRAFNCRSLQKKSKSKNKNVNKPDKQYSSGSTFFIKSNSQPRCLLESIALSIFNYHTSNNNSNNHGLPEYDANTSGAEWWTQVIDHRDEIGMHWDRDYGKYIYIYLYMFLCKYRYRYVY